VSKLSKSIDGLKLPNRLEVDIYGIEYKPVTRNIWLMVKNDNLQSVRNKVLKECRKISCSPIRQQIDRQSAGEFSKDVLYSKFGPSYGTVFKNSAHITLAKIPEDVSIEDGFFNKIVEMIKASDFESRIVIEGPRVCKIDYHGSLLV
jgi:hypothetical protein